METVTSSNILPDRKPKWLRVKLPTGKKYTELRSLVDKYKLKVIISGAKKDVELARSINNMADSKATVINILNEKEVAF
jgi:lipoate synthase